MASRVFPIGTPLTVVWHFSKPDGTTFDLSGYTYRVYYRTGNRQTEVNSTHLTASGNMLTVVIPADMQYAPGEYSLKLVLYQNSSIFCTLVYNVAFVLSQQMSGDPTTETQSEGGNTVHLYTVAEFYMFSPVVPTVGNDGYWYVNGNKISDGNGEFIPSSHTVEYDAATNRIIIDRGRVNQQGQSIAQVITSLADALGIASQSHNTAEQDHDRAETDHDNAGDDHTNAQSDHEAIQQLIEQYEPIVINGDVTNAPDEEDITSDTNGLLKFKDRGTIYGMGYVILRKDKTFSEQLTKTNTIYEIRYDFDLDGESVTIPVGCILLFLGGSLSNGSIFGTKTIIAAENVEIFDNVSFSGTFKNSKTYFGWFAHSASDNTEEFRALFALSSGEIHTDVIIEEGSYNIQGYDSTNSTPFVCLLPDNAYIHNAATINILPSSNAQSFPLYSKGHDNIVWDGGSIIGSIDSLQESPGEHGHGIHLRGAKNVTIKNVTIKKCFGDGINLQYGDTTYGHNENIRVTNVICDYNARQGISVEDGIHVIVENSLIANTGKILGKAPKGGIDIEPAYADASIDNILVHDCLFKENQGYDVIVDQDRGSHGTIVIDNIVADRGIHVGNGITAQTPRITIRNSSFLIFTFNNISDVLLQGCSFGVIRNEAGKALKLNIVDCNIQALTAGLSSIAAFYFNGTHDAEDITFKNCNIDIANINFISSRLALKFINCTIACPDSNLSLSGSYLDCYINMTHQIRWFAVDDTVMMSGCKIHIQNTGVTYGSGDGAIMLMSGGKSYDVVDTDVVSDVSIAKGAFVTYYNIGTAASLTLNNSRFSSFNRNVIEANSMINLTYMPGFFARINGIPMWHDGTHWGNSDSVIMDNIQTIRGATPTRTSLGVTSDNAGLRFYDTSLKKYCLWNGTAWVNLDGTALE